MIDDPLLKSEANQAFEAMIQLKMNKQIDPAGMTRGCHPRGTRQGKKRTKLSTVCRLSVICPTWTFTIPLSTTCSSNVQKAPSCRLVLQWNFIRSRSDRNYFEKKEDPVSRDFVQLTLGQQLLSVCVFFFSGPRSGINAE